MERWKQLGALVLFVGVGGAWVGWAGCGPRPVPPSAAGEAQQATTEEAPAEEAPAEDEIVLPSSKAALPPTEPVVLPSSKAFVPPVPDPVVLPSSKAAVPVGDLLDDVPVGQLVEIVEPEEEEEEEDTGAPE